MSQIQAYFTEAELALAAYANLNLGTLNTPSQQEALRGAGLSPSQAVRFANNWRVVDQLNNPLSGLSATVFEEITTGKRYLAIRGTDDFIDLVTGVVNIGVIGTPLLQPQYLILRSKVQEWLVNGTLPKSFTVTGHSLGGFLATGIAAEFSGNVEHTYLYNAPGLNGVLGSATALILQALGIVAPMDITNASNLKADAGISPITGLGAQIAPPILVAIENQFLSDVANPPAAKNHSQQVLADSLAVYSLLDRIKSGISVDEVSAIVKAASNRNSETLESVVTPLAKIFGTATVSRENREELYRAISDIAALMPADGSSPFRLVSLVGQDAGLVASAAMAQGNDGLAYRYALRELNPFVVTGVDYQSRFNQDSELSLYDPAASAGLTQAYLADRATMLVWKNLYYQKDGNIALRGNRTETLQFTDKGIKNDATGQDLTLTVVGRNSLLIDNPAKTIFGSDADETLVGGNIAAGDHLYGGGGADTLQGNQGNDYLEGGRGNDTYVWNTGDGFDTILDTDGVGRLVVNGKVVSGAIQVTQNDYISADGQHLLHFEGDPITGGVLIVNGDLEIENFKGGYLGIALHGQSSLAEIQPTTTTFLERAPNGVVFGTNGPDYFLQTSVNAIDANGSFHGGGGDDLFELDVGTVFGGAGDDLIVLANVDSSYPAEIAGDAGSDHIFSGAGGDIIRGDFFSDFHESWFSVGSFRYILDPELGLRGWYVDPTGSESETFIPDGGYFAALRYALGISESTDVASLYDDYIDGGAGNDIIVGEMGSDTIFGGAGSDRIWDEYFNGGAPRFDTFLDEAFKNSILALVQAPGDDYLDGGADNDELHAGKGDDTLVGGNGDDQLYSEVAGNDILIAGDGDDILSNIDLFSENESYSNYLEGGVGNDILHSTNASLEGVDTLIGGPGNDTLTIGSSGGYFEGGVGSDSYSVVSLGFPFLPQQSLRSVVINDLDETGADIDSLSVIFFLVSGSRTPARWSCCPCRVPLAHGYCD